MQGCQEVSMTSFMKYIHRSLTTHTFRNVKLLSFWDDEGEVPGEDDAVMSKKDMVRPDCRWFSFP